MSSITHIVNTITPLQQQLNEHKVYQHLTTPDLIIKFMSHHVYCVWDFMNLLKTLQVQLTCTSLPWKPYANPYTTRLINEIVLEEESDIIDNSPTSHFAYYVNALKTLDPQHHNLTLFLTDLNQSTDYKTLIQQPYIPQPVQEFLAFSYTSIQQSLLHTAAAFTFGREALVPDLFLPIVNQLSDQQQPTFIAFTNYLNRHIELDGEQHSKLAYNMIEHLCKTDQDWTIVTQHAEATLQARLQLWDSILQSLT